MIYGTLFRTGFKPLVAATFTLAMAGCSISLFPQKQPQRQFTLPYHFQADSAGAETPAAMPVLKVDRPQASGVAGGKRVVIETHPDELAAYQSVRWTTDAPVLVRDHLVRALRQDPRLGTVVSDTSGARSQVSLTSALQSFQEDRTGDQPVIRLRLETQLVENGSREALATHTFDIEVPIAEGELEDTISAFGRATDRLAAQVADWLSAELAGY